MVPELFLTVYKFYKGNTKMAVLSSPDLVELMRYVNRNVATQTWTKQQIGAALQAVEDRMVLPATRTALGGDIEAAAPGVFNATQKELLFAVWCLTYARRTGVI